MSRASRSTLIPALNLGIKLLTESYTNHQQSDQCKIESVKQIILRILAVFAASGLSVIGAGAIAGVPLWKACLMAGVAGVATVVEGLARAYMDDGQIDSAEINDVFNKVDKKSK